MHANKSNLLQQLDYYTNWKKTILYYIYYNLPYTQVRNILKWTYA